MNASIGRIVHFVMDTGSHHGEHRAAIITNVFPENRVNLSVFVDGRNDLKNADIDEPTILRRHTISQSDKHEEGTWHQPEMV